MIKSILILTSATIIGTTALAGAGGYTTETCVSSSGRTVLTLLFSDSSETQVNLIIDGVSTKYVNEVDGISVVTGNDTVAVFKGDQFILNSTRSNVGKGSNSQLQVAASADPRKGSVINEHASAKDLVVSQNCTVFTKEP